MQKIETLRELQMAIFKVLCDVADVCEEQGFRYSLGGGTMLGAIRHKGFIPWDDDIDIMMPRPDYEALIEYCRTHETKFKLLCNKLEPKYGYLFAKAWDPATKIVELQGNKNNIDYGLYVDIFPLDAAGDSVEEVKRRFSKNRFMFEMIIAANWKKYFRSFGRPWYYEPIRYVFYLMSRFVDFETAIPRLEKHFVRYEFGTTKYIFVTAGAYRLRDIWPKEWIDGFVEKEFEGRKFTVISGYDAYLKNLYGDYMQLPPKEQQISHHDYDAWWRE